MKKLLRYIVRRPIAVFSLVILIILYFMMLFAEFISPYHSTTTYSYHGNHPPSLTFYSKQHGFCPQVQKTVLVNELKYRYARVRSEYYRVHLFVKGPEYKLWGLFKSDIHLFGTKEAYSGVNSYEEGGQSYPVYLFGSDNLGRCVFSRILYGSRISLTIGFIGIFISLALAVFFGGIAGYYGGWYDWTIMRVAEFFILIPGLYLILFLRSILSRDMDSGQSFIIITVILSFVGWPGTARLLRGMIHSIKREDFVTNARLEGIPSLVIIVRHIIPQMSSILIISITLGIPGFILGETVLSYLGLGIIDPAVSWGSLIKRDVTSLNNLKNFPWFLMPGVFLIITSLSFNFIGELLRDLFDPYFQDKSGG